MESIKRVMLAVKAPNLEAIGYPVLASPKIDGVRGTIVNGVLVSRTMKLIPNKHTQQFFGKSEFNGLDGELVVGSPADHNCMQNTMSGVMSRDGTPDVKLFVFDNWQINGTFTLRNQSAHSKIKTSGYPQLVWLDQTPIIGPQPLLKYEEEVLNQGYEGVIVRSMEGPYKQGRSTLREGYMLKIKRFEDSEAEIISCYELMHNDNEATIDERGYTKRATFQANKRAAGVLGGFVVKDIKSGVEFEIGTGFTMEQRNNLWEGRRYLKDRIVKYKHFPVGVVDKPRHPIFLGFRDVRDL